MIFGKIRNFMDTANRQYLQRKKRSEYIENQRIASEKLSEKQKDDDCIQR